MANDLMKTDMALLPLVQQRIFTLRGQQVMIDRDLAELYGVETRVLNQAVKRNAERFPAAFHFQLSEQDLDGETVYHLGASLKDLGKKWFAFSRMEKSGLKVMEKLEEVGYGE